MKKPEILIGDFIRFNSPSLNNMTTQAPDVATAFSLVMKQLAIKYGNISLPGGTTPGIIQEQKLLELTKDDIANGIIGDIVKVKNNDDFLVITDVKFKDTFNNTFEVELTFKPFKSNLKNKNKGIVAPLKNYYEYFVNPYSNTYLQLGSLDIIDYRNNCLSDLLSSMPLFKFKKGSEDSKDYIFMMDVREKLKNPNAGYYDKSYWFVNVNTQENLYLDCDGVIKMFFNEEINKDKLVCQTYLLPLLYQKNLYEIKATDILGIKVIPIPNLNNSSPQSNFYTIDKLITNKPKNKIFELVEYDSSGARISSTTRTITPNNYESMFRNFYTGVTSSGFDWFIESPFEKTTPREFMTKFRTYSKEDYENIFGYFDLSNYLKIIINVFDNTDTTRNGDKTNYDIAIEVFGGFEQSIYVKELLETKLTFENPYMQNQELPYRIYKLVSDNNPYIFKDGKTNYNFNTYNRSVFHKMFTVLPQSPKVGAFRSSYQQPRIHLPNIPMKPGTAIMYLKGTSFNATLPDVIFKQIFEYSSVKLDTNTLDFTYIPEGNIANVNDKKVTQFTFKALIQQLKTGDIKTLDKSQYKKLFNKEIGEIEFNIGQNFLFSTNDTNPVESVEVIDRYIQSSQNTTGRLKIKLESIISGIPGTDIQEYSNLFNQLNPYNLKIGDKVTIVEGGYVNSYLKELIEKANQPYYEIITTNNSSSRAMISVSQAHFNNARDYDGQYWYNLLPYDQSTNVTSPIQETFGLKIGDDLPADVISSWAKENKNYYGGTSTVKWSQGMSTVFIDDRTIAKFEMLDGQLGFLVSGTQGIYLKAEGFKEFLEGNTQKTQATNSDIITSSLLPGLEILKYELGPKTYNDTESSIKMFTNDWRLPTSVEMALIGKDQNITTQYDKYWVQGETVYSCNEDKTLKVLSNFEKWHYFMVKGSFNPNTQTTTTTNDEIKVGDIVEWHETIPNYSAKKGARALVDSITEEFYFVEWLDNLANGAVNGGYMKEDFVKSANQTPPSTNSTKKVTQNIETIPAEMSVDLKIDSNTGNRNSPTQSAGELKTMIKGSPYETEVLNAYYIGNDGDWYKLNVEKSGVWKWKKADPQPAQNATTTLNKDYASMTQNELKQRISDLKVAMTVFDEEDDEYKDFETELDLIELYVEN